MSVNKTEMLNELYDAALVTGGAVAMSMIGKKVANMPLSTPESLKGTAKLALAVGLSTIGVKYI